MIVSLATAREESKVRYFTGVPCAHGHVAERFTCNQSCVVCSKERQQRAHATLEGAARRNALRREWRSIPENRNKERQAGKEAKRKKLGLPPPTRAEPRNCEACGKPGLKGALALDHSHVTGEFRGWLCARCNIALGYLRDDVEAIKGLLDYMNAFIKGDWRL